MWGLEEPQKLWPEELVDARVTGVTETAGSETGIPKAQQTKFRRVRDYSRLKY